MPEVSALGKALGIVVLVLVPFIAILAEGMRRKLIARFQNRIGPPIIQPLYDFMKLLGKERSTSSGYGNVFFRTVPFLYLVATYSLFLFVPFPLVAFDYDFIFLIYLTILGSAFYILAGVASASPYGIIGSMREMIVMVVYEISLAVLVLTFFIHSGALSFADFANLSSKFLVVQLPFAALLLFAVSLFELKITPFDTVEASAEIYVGAETEYSGMELAFLSLAGWMKIPFYIFLLATLALGTADLGVFAIGSLFLLFLLPLLRATTNRYRVDQAFSAFAVILALSLINLMFVL